MVKSAGKKLRRKEPLGKKRKERSVIRDLKLRQR